MDKHALNIVHQNIQGLSSKALEIELFLKKYNVQILCVTEHWLKMEQLLLFNNEYFSVGSAFVRKKTIHGGSLIYVCSSVNYKERKDIADLSIERTIELSCVELKQYIVVCVYRPPQSDFILFETVMEDVMKRLSSVHKHVIVCGDFNVDLLVQTQTSIRLISLFNSFNLKHLFLEPTRITSHSATCLDNIFCNCEYMDKAILSDLTSDHCGQKAVFPLGTTTKGSKITCRPMTSVRLNRFTESVAAAVTHIDPRHDDPNELYESLFNTIQSAYNASFPTRTFTKNIKIKFCDWATSGIYKSRAKLYELYGMKQYNFDPVFIQYVRDYSKIFKKTCFAAKSLYLSNKIKQSENKIKTTWNVINSETGRIKLKDNNYELNIKDNIISNNTDVAQIFNDFFISIPVKTTSSLDSCPIKAERLLRGNVKECDAHFNFNYVNPNDIIKVFKSLNSKNTADLWGISVKLVESIISNIAPYLAAIFNKSVDAGVFPDLMKHSKVVPLFKNGSKSDPSNFRPISILPAISKIFEKIILQQLESHFNFHKLLHNEQYGFTKGRSTTDAGVTLIKHIFNAWENSMDAIGVFCDLSKAFDCVEHNTLLSKLSHYGIRDVALNLISTYLSDRVQYVDVNGSRSSGLPVAMGVPQGSILGPFLFLVYINDLPYFVQDLCDIVLFADDTSLIFKVSRKDPNFDVVNSSLAQVLNWFKVNNLLLNSKKTKCIKFSMPNVKSPGTNLVLNNESVLIVESTVFLGLTLDCKLQWGAHISCLAGKLSSAAFAVRKVRQLTDVETARLVYFSYFHSVMSYGILLWGKAADIETIFVVQKRAIRSIYNLGSRVSLRERFKEIGILTVASQYIYANVVYVKSNIGLYTRNCDVHEINTRGKHKLVGSHYRLHKVHNSFTGLGVRLYNKLPIDVMEKPLDKFKQIVKKHLIHKGYYTVNEYLNDKKSWDARLTKE